MAAESCSFQGQLYRVIQTATLFSVPYVSHLQMEIIELSLNPGEIIAEITHVFVISRGFEYCLIKQGSFEQRCVYVCVHFSLKVLRSSWESTTCLRVYFVEKEVFIHYLAQASKGTNQPH